MFAAPLLADAPSPEAVERARQRARADRGRARLEDSLRSSASLFSSKAQAAVATGLSIGPIRNETVGQVLRRVLGADVFDVDITAMLTRAGCESPRIIGWGGTGSPVILPSREILGLPPLGHGYAAPTARSSQDHLETLAKLYRDREKQRKDAAERVARAAEERRVQQVLAEQREAERERLARAAAAEQAALASVYATAMAQARRVQPGVGKLRVATHRLLLETLRQGGWIAVGKQAPATDAEQRNIERHEAAHIAASAAATADAGAHHR